MGPSTGTQSKPLCLSSSPSLGSVGGWGSSNTPHLTRKHPQRNDRHVRRAASSRLLALSTVSLYLPPTRATQPNRRVTSAARAPPLPRDGNSGTPQIPTSSHPSRPRFLFQPPPRTWRLKPTAQMQRGSGSGTCMNDLHGQ